MNINPVILAGGSGSRLWPKSRKNYPKPFLKLTRDNTLLQATVLRLRGIPSIKPPIIVCNEDHSDLVIQQVAKTGQQLETIILEPTIKNTAPALTLAALHCEKEFGDSILLCLPADHEIKDQSLFQHTIDNAVPLARKSGVVTFGIPPNKPRTEYGYIGFEEGNGSPYPIREFVEKPELETAVAMIESGGFLWKSGIFMMLSSVWLTQISRYEPDIICACQQAFESANRHGKFLRPNKHEFMVSPSKSIDYAVMEPTTLNHDDITENWVVPMEVGWSDLGTWDALWEEQHKDNEGNFTQGNTILQSVTNSLVISEHRAVAVTDLSNLAIIETDDVVLVSNRNKAQNIKSLIESFTGFDQNLLVKHGFEKKPWGKITILSSGKKFQVKLLTVNPQSSLSLQSHKRRSEHWIVMKGTASITKGTDKYEVPQNGSAFIPAGEKHRIENHTDDVVEIIEVQTGTYFGEDDIIRYEDKYNRD